MTEQGGGCEVLGGDEFTFENTFLSLLSKLEVNVNLCVIAWFLCVSVGSNIVYFG
jgi:hypothetical protein